MPDKKEKRKPRKTDPPSTTAVQDVLKDPLKAPPTRERHSPFDKTSTLEPGTYGSGSITTTVAGAGNTLDGASATKSFLHQKKTHPELSDKQAWERALQYDVNPGGERTELVGSDPDHYDDGLKVAWVIGNQHYPNQEDLPGAAADARSMAAHYQGQGYTTIHVEDRTGSQMEGDLNGLESLGDGDAGALYYAGHGQAGGLWGVDDVSVPASVVASTTSTVLGNGARLDVVIDACESGGLQTAVEEEFGFDKESRDLPHADAVESARKGYGFKGTGDFPAHEKMIMKGEEMSPLWHLFNPKGTTIY